MQTDLEKATETEVVAAQNFSLDDPKKIAAELDGPLRENIRQLLECETIDIRWRLSARRVFAWGACTLLVIQNIAVFVLVYFAFFYNALQQLQPIIGILVSATLLETVGLIKIMVDSVFKDITYNIPKQIKTNV